MHRSQPIRHYRFDVCSSITELIFSVRVGRLRKQVQQKRIFEYGCYVHSLPPAYALMKFAMEIEQILHS